MGSKSRPGRGRPDEVDVCGGSDGSIQSDNSGTDGHAGILSGTEGPPIEPLPIGAGRRIVVKCIAISPTFIPRARAIGIEDDEIPFLPLLKRARILRDEVILRPGHSCGAQQRGGRQQ